MGERSLDNRRREKTSIYNLNRWDELGLREKNILRSIKRMRDKETKRSERNRSCLEAQQCMCERTGEP